MTLDMNHLFGLIVFVTLMDINNLKIKDEMSYTIRSNNLSKEKCDITFIRSFIQSFLIPVVFEGRKEMFYLTMHSTHFIYGYMVSDIR